jgi:hypothetical protein
VSHTKAQKHQGKTKDLVKADIWPAFWSAKINMHNMPLARAFFIFVRVADGFVLYWNKEVEASDSKAEDSDASNYT